MATLWPISGSAALSLSHFGLAQCDPENSEGSKGEKADIGEKGGEIYGEGKSRSNIW